MGKLPVDGEEIVDMTICHEGRVGGTGAPYVGYMRVVIAIVMFVLESDTMAITVRFIGGAP